MMRTVKVIFVISGILTFLSPALMLYFWNRYVTEQEQLYGQQSSNKKGCSPYDFVIRRDQEGKMVMQWKTTETCTGYVLLGKNYSDFSYLPYQIFPSQIDEKVNNHTVSLLKQDELVFTYAIIVSNHEWYGIKGMPFSFKHLSLQELSTASN